MRDKTKKEVEPGLGFVYNRFSIEAILRGWGVMCFPFSYLHHNACMNLLLSSDSVVGHVFFFFFFFHLALFFSVFSFLFCFVLFLFNFYFFFVSPELSSGRDLVSGGWCVYFS